MDGPLGDAHKLPTRELAGDVSQEGLRMSLPGADTPMIMRMDLTLERPVSPCRRQGRGLGGDVCKTFPLPNKSLRAQSYKFHFLFVKKLGEFFSDLWQNQIKAGQSRLLVLEVTRVFLLLCVSGRHGY